MQTSFKLWSIFLSKYSVSTRFAWTVIKPCSFDQTSGRISAKVSERFQLSFIHTHAMQTRAWGSKILRPREPLLCHVRTILVSTCCACLINATDDSSIWTWNRENSMQSNYIFRVFVFWPLSTTQPFSSCCCWRFLWHLPGSWWWYGLHE